MRKSKDLNELSDTIHPISLSDNIKILSLLLLLFVSLTFQWHILLIYSINVNIKHSNLLAYHKKDRFFIDGHSRNINVSSQFKGNHYISESVSGAKFLRLLRHFAYTVHFQSIIFFGNSKINFCSFGSILNVF